MRPLSLRNMPDLYWTNCEISLPFRWATFSPQELEEVNSHDPNAVYKQFLFVGV
jgi:hypothetical protein